MIEFMGTTEIGVIIGAILAALYGLFNTVSWLIETFSRSKADKAISGLEGQIQDKKGKLDEANKNSISALDKYRESKRKYDESK